ncbi:hypothetical protein Tco_0591674 [Tanacetum coccineum]
MLEIYQSAIDELTSSLDRVSRCQKCQKMDVTSEGFVDSGVQESNVVNGYVFLNDHYAFFSLDSVLRSVLVSSAFTPFIDIAPYALRVRISHRSVPGDTHQLLDLHPVSPSEMYRIIENQLKGTSREGILFDQVTTMGLAPVLFVKEEGRVEVSLNWKTPESPTEIRSFLGLAVRYMRIFIQPNDPGIGVSVVFDLKIWKEHYLYGTKSVIYTGPKMVSSTYSIERDEYAQRRWIELLMIMECEINNTQAEQMLVADALSRKRKTQAETSSCLSITIHSGLKTRILETHAIASKDIKSPS